MKKPIALSFLFTVILILGLVACSNPTIESDQIKFQALEPTEQLPTTAAAQIPPLDSQLVKFQPADAVAGSVTNQDQALALENSLIELYQQANPAVVYIVAAPISSGSGFVYNNDGYIITNNHVINGADIIEIVFASGDRQVGQVVGTDLDSDLAVLKVESLPDGVEPLPLAESSTIQVGQFVVAIGNPFGEQGSMSLGIISGLGRSLQSQRAQSGGSTYSLPQVIQTDAPINPGNSGGPLLNLDGEVMGINAAIASTTGTGSGVGFAIPVDAIRRIAPSLISDGGYSYPYIGAGFDDEINLREQNIYGLTQFAGAYVLNVTEGSPAAAAGLRPANANTGKDGDLVIAIDDQPIADFGDLNSYLVFQATVGQTIELTIIRDGETITVPLTLGERP